MKKIILIAFIAISLFAIEKDEITTVMENKINQATSIIKKDISAQEKAEKIFPLFEDVFDYKLMTKLSLGKANWSKMTPEQRKEFTTKFITYLKHSYVKKISLYTDEKLKIIGLKDVKKRVYLLTQLVGSKEAYDIAYKFYKSKTKGWLIYDVDIIGISLIQIYRAQFKDILEKESYAALLGKIESQ